MREGGGSWGRAMALPRALSTGRRDGRRDGVQHAVGRAAGHLGLRAQYQPGPEGRSQEPLDVIGRGKGVLLQISQDGYYEVNCVFGERMHRTLFPIFGTVLISREPEDSTRLDLEIER